MSLARALLAPTRIYVKSCLAAIRAGGVKAMSHITGGGLTENIPRVLPDGVVAPARRPEAGRCRAVFGWLAGGHQGSTVGAAEMARTFNCGIGMVVVVDPSRRRAASPASSSDEGETVAVIGELVAAEGEARVEIAGLARGLAAHEDRRSSSPGAAATCRR